jgi:hypothetical protein
MHLPRFMAEEPRKFVKMNTSGPVVKLFGIEIRADLTWALAFSVILWSLGNHYFPIEYQSLISLPGRCPSSWRSSLRLTWSSDYFSQIGM